MDIYSKELLMAGKKLPSGTVLFDSSTAGTYNITIEYAMVYDVIMVGAGGGGDKGAIYTSYGGGGSGAAFVGRIKIEKGSLKVVVGAGGNNGYYGGTLPTSGGSSSIGDNYVGGGIMGSYGGKGGSKGSMTYKKSTLWVAGNAGSAGYANNNGGASVYGGYGAGAPASGGRGGSGYVKIYVA